MLQDRVHIRNILILIGVGLVFFIVGNNILALTNPDEVFYSLTAKEMIRHKTWLVPYIFGQPHFEKPILTFWLLRLSFAVFGITNFAARLPPAVFAILGGLTAYYFCLLSFRDKGRSFLCALILMSSALYISLGRFLLTDMIFSVFTLMALTAFYAGYIGEWRKDTGLILFFACAALAVLTKGLLGIVLPAGTVLLFLTLRRDLKFIFGKPVFYGGIVFLVLALPWYAYMFQRYGHSFVQEFFYNDHIRRILEAEHHHNDTWYFYPMTIVLGMLPWSIFVIGALAGLKNTLRDNAGNPVYLFLVSWILFDFVVFQSAHSKLVSYILPLMPAVAVVTGDYVSRLCDRKSGRSLFVMLVLSSLLLFLLSLSLMLLASGKLPFEFKYYEYVPDTGLIVALFVLSTAVVAGSIFTSLTGVKKTSFYILALQVPLLLMLAFGARSKYESYVSSKEVGRYLLAHEPMQNRILCSKMFARGIRYYTGNDVAVIGSPFFSPHPVPTLTGNKDILKFLESQGKTIAIVRKGQYRQIRKLSQKRFTFTELWHTGDAYIVEINEA